MADGYVKTYKELIETTDWDAYGRGKDPRCANCMAHCGYEPSAVLATMGSLRESMRAIAAAEPASGPLARARGTRGAGPAGHRRPVRQEILQFRVKPGNGGPGQVDDEHVTGRAGDQSGTPRDPVAPSAGASRAGHPVPVHRRSGASAPVRPANRAARPGCPPSPR